MKIVAALSVPTMVLGLTALGAAPASAHTPAISADCGGVTVAGTAYDGGQANRWTVTIDGVTLSGTFDTSFSQTFPVPQDGATSTWSAVVEGWDGNYRGEDAGTVGPCGTPPPVDACPELDGDQPDGTACTTPPSVERADAKQLEGCTVSFEGKSYGAGTLTYEELYTDTFAFNPVTNAWDLVTDTAATIANIEFSPWTRQQEIAKGCLTVPTEPPAQQEESSSTRLDCDDEVWVTEHVVTTTPFAYDEQTNTWVPGQPVSETTIEETPVEPGDCTDPEVEGVRAAVLPQPAAVPSVPTVVNAGLAPAAPAKQAVAPTTTPATTQAITTVAGPATAATPAGLRGGALALLLGAGLMLAGGVVRKRTM